MSVINKSAVELETASFFCSWLNNCINAAYTPLRDPFDRECDFILVEENKDPIKLQITTSEHKLIDSMVSAKKEPGILQPGIDPDHISGIIRAIVDKSKYSNAVQEELVLLIYSILGRFNEDYLKKMVAERFPINNFKNIYFVELPCNDQRTSHPTFKGKVVQLK